MDAIRSVEYTIDIDQYKKLTPKILKQLDSTSITLIIKQNGVATNLSGNSFVLNFGKPDGSVVIQTNGINTSQVTSGILTIELDEDCIRVPGEGYLEVEIRKDGKKITNYSLPIYIDKSLVDSMVPSQNKITLIEELEAKIQEGLVTKEELDAWVEAHQDIVDLDNRVTQNSSQLEDIPNQTYITEKAKQTDLIELQSQVTGLASGSPKAVSLVSQMIDTSKNYVYTGSEGGYTSGHWYYWNGSAWTSGGVYQSTGISNDSILIDYLTTYVREKTLGAWAVTKSNYKIGIDPVNDLSAVTGRTFIHLYPSAFEGTLKKVQFYCKTTGKIKLKIISFVSGSTYKVESTSSDITIGSTGIITLLDGTDFSNLKIKQNQFIAVYCHDNAVVSYSAATALIASYTGEASNTFNTTTINGKLNLNFEIAGGEWKDTVDSILPNIVTKAYLDIYKNNIKKYNKLFNTTFPLIGQNNLPNGMDRRGEWGVNNSLVTLDGTTLDGDWCVWDIYSTVDKATLRTRIRIETLGRFALIRKPPVIAGKQGTICEIDSVNNQIKFYNQWNGNVPLTCTVQQTFNIPFTLVAGREYVISLEKDTSFNKATITDTITQQTYTATFDNQTVSYGANVGKQWGAPGVMYLGTGRFRVLSFDFIVDFSKRVSCVIMGDSITEGYALNDISQPLSVRWCAKVQSDLNGKCVISGAGGQKSDDLIQRLNIDFDTYITDYMMFLIGTNDVSQSIPIETIKSNITTIINRILAKGSIPVLCAIPQKTTSTDSTISALNTWLRTLGYTVIGFDYALSTDGTGQLSDASYFVDGTHPNVTGNDKMHNQVKIDAPFLFD